MLHAVFTWFSYMFNPQEKISSKSLKGAEVERYSINNLKTRHRTDDPAIKVSEAKSPPFYFLLSLVPVIFSFPDLIMVEPGRTKH